MYGKGREGIFNELSGGRIESVDVGAFIVGHPEVSSLFVDYDSVSAEVGCRRPVVSELLGFLIKLAESVIGDISKPYIVVTICLNTSHGFHIGNWKYLDVASLRINPEKTWVLITTGAPAIVVRVCIPARSRPSASPYMIYRFPALPRSTRAARFVGDATLC